MLSKGIAQHWRPFGRMAGPSFTKWSWQASRAFSDSIGIPEKELRYGQMLYAGLAAAGLGLGVYYATTPPVKYAYIHGFASGPKATKGMLLRSCFDTNGLCLELPDLNQPSFEKLTCTAALKEMDRLHERAIVQAGRPVKWCIVGSSMGSYMAARWAELHPDRVDKLVLLSPAFSPDQVCAGIMPKGKTLKDWRAKGTWPWPGPDGTPSHVHWGFMSDLEQHPSEPTVPCETLIIHGKDDKIVPLNIAESYAEAHKQRVKLVVLEDDHSLVKSMPTIVKLLSEFFKIRPELAPPSPLPSRQAVAQFDHSQKDM